MKTTQPSSRTCQIYYRQTDTWVTVSKEDYEGYAAETMQYCDQQHKCNECTCPMSKRWMCDADCLTCPFMNWNAHASLDEPAFGRTDIDMRHLRWLEDASTPGPDEVSDDLDLIARLRDAIMALNKGDRKLIRMYMAGKTREEMASLLGLKDPRCVERRMKRILKALKIRLED